MNIYNAGRGFLKKATGKEIDQILDESAALSIQRDIAKLRFKGYDPADYPNDERFYNFRKGQRLTSQEVASVLEISPTTVAVHTRLLIERWRRSGLFAEVFKRLESED